MITDHRPLIAGNWKMNGRKLSLKELGLMIEGYAGLRDRVDLLLCPPFTLLHAAAVIALGSGIAIGAQDCHTEPSGAHTGDISAGMIADCGATHVILGHSERRAGHSESDALVKSKTAAAHAAGLHAVVCIGETLTQRDAGKAVDVTRRQLSRSLPDSATAANTTIAYEPVWAIGTGLVPVNENIIEIHAAIREGLSRGFGKKPGAAFRILYGGSVKPGNAKEILGLANVNGALAGGASLKAADFLAIAASV